MTEHHQHSVPYKEHAILHVLVVGFHHKRGYQIEYCYPAIAGASKNPDLESAFPPEWRELASLAIPDGAHNVESDTIYFLLPSAEELNRAIFGISCYRQIAVDDDLREKDDEVTRSSIQKSVCVLLKLPLFGILKSKLEVITHAYFNEKDFSKVEVLVQMYNNLCDLFDSDYLDTQDLNSGISLLPLLRTFRHRTLALFKLLLLEKRVVFNIFPVNLLGDVIIGLISLFPGLLERGLTESASYSVLRMNRNSSSIEDAIDVKDIEFAIMEGRNEDVENVSDVSAINKEKYFMEDFAPTTLSTKQTNASELECRAMERIMNPSSFDIDEYGFPLSIFTKGSVLHPYLSIGSIDMLRSDNVRAFCVGVTNSIFTQRRELIDVIVSINEKNDGQVEILPPDLRRQLTLTKQDLRFIDFLLKMTELNNDPTSWKGSDDWLRLQFYNYILSMLAAANTTPTSTEFTDEFNSEFINSWRTKHNFRVWSSGTYPKFSEVSSKHPFTGQLNVNDVLLRMNHAMNGSGQGRKVISTFTNTGKLVAETGNRFKSSFTSWMRGSSTSTTMTAAATQAANDSNNVKGTKQ